MLIELLMEWEGLLVRDGEVEEEWEMEGEVERERDPDGDLVGLDEVDWLEEVEGLEVVVSPADPRGKRRRRRRTKARGNIPFMVGVSNNRWVYFRKDKGLHNRVHTRAYGGVYGARWPKCAAPLAVSLEKVRWEKLLFETALIQNQRPSLGGGGGEPE